MPRALLLLLALLAACGDAPDAPADEPDTRPHLVLVVADTLRANHLDLYGYERETAPELTAWASEALVFDRATASSNWTRPSMLALFTGQDPGADRLFGRGEVLPEDVPVLAEVLGEAGYTTLGVSTNLFMSPALGAARGFDRYEFIEQGPLGAEVSWKVPLAWPNVIERVDAMLAEHGGDGPVFLYAHFMDPHLPYDPPAELRHWCPPDYDGPLTGGDKAFEVLKGTHVDERLPPLAREQVVGLYDGEIRNLDAGLSALRETVARHLDDRHVVTVMTADHGEAFGEGRRGFYRHGNDLRPDLVHVPLVVAGVGRVGRSDVRVGLVDLLPTLAALADAEAPWDIDGIDILDDPPRGRDHVAYRSLPGDEPGTGELAILRDGLRAERLPHGWQLFDDATGRNVTAGNEGLLGSLRAHAERWLQTSQRRRTGEEAVTIDVSPDRVRELEALGYTGK